MTMSRKTPENWRNVEHQNLARRRWQKSNISVKGGLRLWRVGAIRSIDWCVAGWQTAVASA